MKRFVRTSLAIALALASGSAAALGLGQIELKSKLGEPLLAEIPIISNDPAELERLQAGLASPETFARIGLRPPDAVLTNLQFVSALDAQGNPVIRVTSVQPIQQPLLTFLIEVDWGQGKLVREYSTLLDAPRTVSAPLQPPIQAPTVAPSNTIVREPQPAPVPPGAVAAPADEDAVAVSPEPASPEPASLATDTAIDPAPVPAPTPAPVAAAPAPTPAGRPDDARPDEYGEVQTGETLSRIAEGLDFGATLDQTMIALLNANPEAFIDGNINLLKQGTVLRVPDAAEVRSIEVAQAMAQVREQTRAWRVTRQPVPQPVPTDASIETASTDNPSDAPATAAGGARLEIVPPGASDASQAGTQSGISAGAEGDMVRQEMQQTKETLAARNAELADLKSRVADLEKLQSDQQRLLEMKDNELAAAQQRLAQTQGNEAAASNASLPWVFGGIGLLLLGLLGGWWMRRRAEVASKSRLPVQGTAPSPLAAGFPGVQPVVTPPRSADVASAGVASPTAPGESQAPGPDAAPTEEPAPAERPSPSSTVPTWHANSGKDTLNASASKGPASATIEPAQVDTDAPGTERLELARAYLDLGDRDSARQLLGEVAANGDQSARLQATQLLRELD